MTLTRKTQSRIISATIFGLSAVVSFCVNLLAGLAIGWLNLMAPFAALLYLVLVVINLLGATWLGGKREYALAAGILAGLAVVFVIALALIVFLAWALRDFGTLY